MRSISKSRVALSVVVSGLGLGSVYAAPQTQGKRTIHFHDQRSPDVDIDD